jgi:hypothetical protein
MEELILVYLGPSLALDKAKAILPEAVYRPPAKQGDILSDVVNLRPAIILLIDGEFQQNLSVWHKELVYALQYPGVNAIYGAASMGALRAAELDFLGMIGVGQIYRWYQDGTTEDDAEVVLSYLERDGVYHALSVPLVNIRAGVEHYQREFSEQPEVVKATSEFFRAMEETHYIHRTPSLCEKIWDNHLGASYPCIPQKELDAIELLTNFRKYSPAPELKPTPDHLSECFQALYDRDRKISVKGQLIPQQHIDSHVLLHSPEYERICWDSANQELALILCDAFLVTISFEEAERESNRFQQRCGIETAADFEHMLEANGWTKAEYDRLIIQNARIRKLQHAVTVSKGARRNTRSILDYLRTYQAFEYWVDQAAQKEQVIAAHGIDDWGGIGLERSPWTMLAQYFEAEGLELKCSREEYLLETGFSNQNELTIALNRLLALKET